MAGRPRVYDNAEELESSCDQYFDLCTTQFERPTVTGLALYLGFASKQSLYDYEKNEEFSYPIKKSLTKIENALEKKLTDNSVAGVIFALKNMGWKDKTEVEQSGQLNFVWNEIKNYGTEPETNSGT